MTAGEAPRTDPPYRVEETDQPGVYAVFGDVGGVTEKLAEVRSADGGPITAEDVTGALAQPQPAALVGVARAEAAAVAALEEAVNRRIREVWPR